MCVTASMSVVVLRHPKERRSKCTLEPLRGRPGFRFLKASTGLSFDATGHIVLDVDAPELAPDSAPVGAAPLLLLDSTWKLLPQVRACVSGDPICRSLPHDLRTAYPRRSKRYGDDPLRGLASVEALYAALRLMGHRDDSLLDHYPWKQAFLHQWE